MNKFNEFSSFRFVENELKLALKFSPVIVLNGPMASGKTTLLKRVAEGYSRTDLKAESKRLMAINHPEVFYSSLKLPALIENIEEATEVLPVIYNNRSRLNPGSIILTTNRIPSAELSKFILSLDKQISVFKLSYRSINEINNKESYKLNLGTLRIPANLQDGDDILKLADRAMKSGSDLNELKLLRFLKEKALKAGFSPSEAEFIHPMLSELAKHQGEVLNISKISQKFDISKQNVNAIIHLLERYEVIEFIKPIEDEGLGYATKSDTLLFRNQSLVVELLKIKKPELLLISDHAHQVINSYLINALKDKLTNQGEIFKVSYFENTNGRKVDLIINRAGKLHLILFQLRIVSDKKIGQIEKIFSKSSWDLGASLVITYDTESKGDETIFSRITPGLIE